MDVPRHRQLPMDPRGMSRTDGRGGESQAGRSHGSRAQVALRWHDSCVILPLGTEKGGDAVLPHERSTNRVLCVDDNHDAAESLALLLRLVGLQAEAAFDGPSALRTAAGFLPHACVSDINMPGMDGFELARPLRAGAGRRPLLLIALTALAAEEDPGRGREAG